jgi:predicted ABC-type ATPase
MPSEAPSVVVLAGPNGAGKSTIATELLAGVSDVAQFVDADVFARELSRSPSQADAIGAGRAMLRRLDELAGEHRSFGFETTLASRSFVPRIKRLIARGYRFHLVFLWLPSPDLAVARVADRVRLGGHDVPEATVRRRYRSGPRNFFKLYRPLTTTWHMYDNSTERPQLIASGAGSTTLSVNSPESWRRIVAEVERGD